MPLDDFLLMIVMHFLHSPYAPNAFWQGPADGKDAARKERHEFFSLSGAIPRFYAVRGAELQQPSAFRTNITP
jgi:hypothetical protein